MRVLLLCITSLLMASGLAAQSEPLGEAPAKKATLEERIEILERKAADDAEKSAAEIELLRNEIDALRNSEERLSYEARRKLRVYGDLSIRWFMLDSNGSRSSVNGEGSQINRPEYRARIGATGFLLDEFKHRLKYNIRLSNQGFSEFEGPLGAPAVSYRPFEAYGSTTSLQLDRVWLSHAYKKFLYLGIGRWQTPLRSSELLFDSDVGLTGVWASLDLGRVGKLYESSDREDWRDFGQAKSGFSRLFLTGAAYYLAQDSIGAPEKRSEYVPHGVSLQLAGKVRFGQTEPAWLFGFGFHYFDGEEGISPNVGTGNTVSTTNRVDSNGDITSRMTLADFLLEAYFFEEQSASLKFFAHVVYNFGAKEDIIGGGDYSWGLTGGIQWGALRVEEASEFQIRYSLHYVEPDALIPELNHEEINTNFKGHRVRLIVSLAQGLVVHGGISYGKRVEEGLMGIGRMPNGDPGSPSDDYEMRSSIGIGLRF